MSRPIPIDLSKPPEQARRTSSVRFAALLIGLATLALGVLVVLFHRGSTPSDLASIRSLVEAQRLDEAEAGLVLWLKREPFDDPAWLMLGSVRGIVGHDDEALAAFDRVRERQDRPGVRRGLWRPRS